MEPAQITGVSDAMNAATASRKGLSVLLRERTVKHLGKKQYLLKDIAMNIPNGSLVLLLGGSGAGKTTFMNAIIGYEKADADIYLNGTNIYKQYSQMKYRIGFVTQMNLVRTHDTVGDAERRAGREGRGGHGFSGTYTCGFRSCIQDVRRTAAAYFHCD